MKAAQYLGNKSFDVVPGTRVAPGSDEVRLDVGFVGTCGTDMHIYHGVMDASPDISRLSSEGWR